jgi:hypothetical protein
MTYTLKKTFGGELIYKSLAKCQKEGFRPLFMPEFIEERMRAQPRDDLWFCTYASLSLRIFGRTKAGNKVIAYSHIPLSFQDNLGAFFERETVNGGGILPDEDFYRILDLEDKKNVFVLDYQIFERAKIGKMSLTEALEHPHTIPFFGGKERAEQYFVQFKEMYGDEIDIWFAHPDQDLKLFYILEAGGNASRSLDANPLTNSFASFLCVKECEGEAPKEERPKQSDLARLYALRSRQKPESKQEPTKQKEYDSDFDEFQNMVDESPQRRFNPNNLPNNYPSYTPVKRIPQSGDCEWFVGDDETDE